MTTVDDLARRLLTEVAADFVAKGLGSDAFNDEYVGPSISALQHYFCTEEGFSHVDFDLALKGLESNDLVKTGPMVPYENAPGSQLLILTFFSKREYCYLTEEGYRAAQKMPQAPKPQLPTVNITGGTFLQSAIGIGGSVSQSVSFDISSDTEVIEYLSKLLVQNGLHSDSASGDAVVELVNAAKTGDLRKAKPIYQRLFGAAKEPVKELVWNVLTAFVSKQLGI